MSRSAQLLSALLLAATVPVAAPVFGEVPQDAPAAAEAPSGVVAPTAAANEPNDAAAASALSERAQDAETGVEIAQPAPGPLDKIFLQARSAFERRSAKRLEPLLPALAEHELRDYPELWSLILRLRAAESAREKALKALQGQERKAPKSGAKEKAPAAQDPERAAEAAAGLAAADATFTRFIRAHQGEYVGERATVEYLHLAAERLPAEAFDGWFESLAWNQDDPELAARHALNRLERAEKDGKGGKALPEALAAAKTLYRDSSVPSKSSVRQIGDGIARLDPKWGWTRVVILLQKGASTEAARVLEALPAAERPASMKTLRQILRSPASWLRRQKDLSALPARLAVFAALHVSRSDPAGAARIAEAAVDPKANAFWRSLVWSRIGFTATTRVDPKAHAWFARASSAQLASRSDAVVDPGQLAAWRARASLRALDWKALERDIRAMPEAVRGEETWIYWRGRALAELGNPEAARAEFSRIAPRITFYGKLACDELGLPYAFPKPAPAPGEEAVRRWDANPSIRRAESFYRMGLYGQGHREWNWALRGLGPEDLLSLAAWAGERGIVHRMINTSERSGLAAVRTDQRYPRPQFELLTRVCAERRLPVEWVYGLIRQESRFMPSASSVVGARGLMQVMPGTARWTARRLGISDYRHSALSETEMNLTLGTGYLSMVAEAFGGSRILATAAYNAGPRRARAWREALPGETEAAVFIETIPFFETREYVKNVLANAQSYGLLARAPAARFRDELGTVAPGGAEPPADLP